MSNAYEQVSNLDSTVQDAGLYHGQVRCSEFSNNHGIEMPAKLTHGFPWASSLSMKIFCCTMHKKRIYQ